MREDAKSRRASQQLPSGDWRGAGAVQVDRGCAACLQDRARQTELVQRNIFPATILGHSYLPLLNHQPIPLVAQPCFAAVAGETTSSTPRQVKFGMCPFSPIGGFYKFRIKAIKLAGTMRGCVRFSFFANLVLF